MREEAATFFRLLQNQICQALEEIDGSVLFGSDLWQRTDLKGGDGGGGDTRILKDGNVIEKGGVSFSKVHGHLSAEFAQKLGQSQRETPFFATGVSLVIHPRSPMIPTTHANWRYLEVGDSAWFGGGSDLTPYYLCDEDARHFHRVLKEVCDLHNLNYYPKYKKWCDEYFYLPLREECRGVGGIFFDHLGRDDQVSLEHAFNFVRDLGLNFTRQYIPLIASRKDLAYSQEQREFQLIRRGRYVEFNLLYDRGTHFGLQTKGRTESILMSLPPLVRWEYNFTVEPGTPEARLLDIVRNPQEWV